MKNFYLSKALFSFGNSAITLFLPLFLFQRGVFLWEIFLFYALESLTHALLVIPVGKLVQRFGIINVFAIGIILNIILFISIRLIDIQNNTVLLSLGLFSGLGNVFYWTGYHFYLVQHQSKGTELSNIKIISSIGNIVAPLLSGVIITYCGFSTMFLIFSIVMMLSVFPLRCEKFKIIDQMPNGKEILKEFHWRDALTFGLGFNDIQLECLVWPMYLGTIGTLSLLTIGTTYTVISIVMIVITFIIGKMIDRSEDKILIFSVIGMTIIGLIRCVGIIYTPLLIGITFLSEVFSTGENSTIDHLSYKRARESNVFAYIMFREIAINVGITLFFLIGALTQSYIVLFIIAIAGSLSYLFFLRRNISNL